MPCDPSQEGSEPIGPHDRLDFVFVVEVADVVTAAVGVADTTSRQQLSVLQFLSENNLRQTAAGPHLPLNYLIGLL